MDREGLEAFIHKGNDAAMVESNICFLAENLEQFLRNGERVLICFHRHEYGNISYLMEQAVLRVGAVPVLWNEDMRWLNLLRLSFTSKARTIIGAPMVVLGLSKLAKAQGVPLYIRNAVIAGYPAAKWFKKGIEEGFDCKVWDCFSLWLSGVVCGFSCRYDSGIHIRENLYGIDIVDEAGNRLPCGTEGEVVIYRKDAPDIRLPIGEYAVLEGAACACGNPSMRLVDLQPGNNCDPEMRALGQNLHKWSSILDCRLNRSEYGMELEIIYFPGERLPKLPSVAKLVMRPWNPEKDEPFWFFPLPDRFGFFKESH